MSWPLAKDRVSVASRSARAAPLTVTSYCEAEPDTALADSVSVSVVPAIAKSAPPTSFTSSLKVTRHVRASALVGEVVGSWRTIEVTRGAVVSVVPGALIRILKKVEVFGVQIVEVQVALYLVLPMLQPEAGLLSSDVEVVIPTRRPSVGSEEEAVTT